MTTNNSSICVFYDGGCPLCRREVLHYRKLHSAQNDDEIDWIDISKSTQELKTECINYDDAMRLIHIKDESGVHQVGLEAVLILWDKIPYYRAISHLIRKITVLHPLLERGYEFLAKHRMTLTGRSR